MKKDIHPQFHNNAQIIDESTGTIFSIGSTVKDMTVEISSKSHPFYTGKQRIIDTDNLVDKFEKKLKKADKSRINKKKKKKIKRRKSSVDKIERKQKLTLKDMLKQMQ